jgi:hypothetical protein
MPATHHQSERPWGETWGCTLRFWDQKRGGEASSVGVQEKVPNFPNFFSEVPTFPAQSFRLKSINDVPAFVPRNFRPGQPAPHELQARSTSGNVSGALTVCSEPHMERNDHALLQCAAQKFEEVLPVPTSQLNPLIQQCPRSGKACMRNSISPVLYVSDLHRIR